MRGVGVCLSCLPVCAHSCSGWPVDNNNNHNNDTDEDDRAALADLLAQEGGAAAAGALLQQARAQLEARLAQVMREREELLEQRRLALEARALQPAEGSEAVGAVDDPSALASSPPALSSAPAEVGPFNQLATRLACTGVRALCLPSSGRSLLRCMHRWKRLRCLRPPLPPPPIRR